MCVVPAAHSAAGIGLLVPYRVVLLPSIFLACFAAPAQRRGCGPRPSGVGRRRLGGGGLEMEESAVPTVVVDAEVEALVPEAGAWAAERPGSWSTRQMFRGGPHDCCCPWIQAFGSVP